MRSRLLARLRALEKASADFAGPVKAVLPAWLVEDLQSQGIPFDSSGRPICNA
jgi:hypothetical protein